MEPARLNLLNVLQKNLKYADKKTYIHRLIYIGDYISSTSHDSKLFQLIFESNIKLINDEYAEAHITGFGLFYDGYFIIILEGSEEAIVKHLRTVTESMKQNVANPPSLERMKILIITHHIIKRNFLNWFARTAKPPVLLEKIEATTDPEVTLRQIHTCIRKLYRMSEYLRNQPAGLIRATMDNISEVCQQHLPEFNLLDFLLSSPALLDLNYVLSVYGKPPEANVIQEKIWPIPTDFVPYDILGKDVTKTLIYTPEEGTEEVHEESSNKAEDVAQETTKQ